MLDRFVYGAVSRVSAEAPIPILHTSAQNIMLGGVGNAARNIAALGSRVVLVAVIGDDLAGQEIDGLAAAEGLIDARLAVESGRQSTVKTRYIASGQQLLRADEETVRPLPAATVDELAKQIETAVTEVDVVVLSDYAKGVLADGVLQAAIETAKAAGVPIIVDPKRGDFAAYAGATVLKPNRAELATATNMPCDSDEAVEAAARKAMAEWGFEAVLVSRSQQGLSLVRRDTEALHIPAHALEVFDVSGAGDTVVATLAASLATGADLASAAQLANIAAGVVVGKVGTATVSGDELAQAVMAAEVTSSEAKVVSAQSAADTVARWRAQGFRVGFTNGCFDLLHPGHVSLLSEARASCDRLIVGLNTDDSVRRLKGEDRPVQSETARALVLASLAVVDLVVMFSEDTPIRLVQLLRPDVLVKGGDYALEEVVGADVVMSYGGEVKLAAIVPGHSSSDVISRMAKRRSNKA
jgi:D-beta-D-heptose 7-phosphate kinase/D-beta-D-heptose 1-phosphate adenosyltransferase